ncbi:MAG: peptidoglycan DD-metalloendopeptidase family protein [Bacteroidetes bacterium]|nr:peptidoglycan DD-metalloendopeptidase family protein [Bacteroidota bacterium]
MKRLKFTLTWMMVICTWALQAQVLQADGGGSAPVTNNECLSLKDYTVIYEALKISRQKLQMEGILLPLQPNVKMITLFQWPLKKATSLNDPGYWSISNYLDQDNTPAIKDYNCGNIAYNGHKGTDIFTWPFWWYKMDNNQVEVIAAAPGTIIYKSNGNFDRSCTTNNNQWNAIYIQHNDGSIAWYGHLKNNSITSKAVGATVTLGEYLGVVGSSGNSTGPHLHFEVYDPNGALVDPWQGTCNTKNANSWWAAQVPYTESGLNALKTHNAAPVFPACPATETLNYKDNFCGGNTVYFASYYHNQQNGQTAQHKIYMPNNSIWQQWTQNFTVFYSASWWYWTWVLPTNASTGTWRYEITYLGNTYTHFFTVGAVATISPASPTILCQGQSTVLTANGGNSYLWSNGATTQSISVSSSGTYTVSVTNSCGAVSSSPHQVTVNSLPTATITPAGATTFCKGASVLLQANTGQGLSYLWMKNNVSISNATLSNYTATLSGTYKVRVTNANGCTKVSAGRAVTVSPMPAATITPSGNVSLCAGDSLQVQANNGNGLAYQWRKGSNAINGATANSYQIKSAGTYRVVVTNSFGCTKTSPSTIATINCKVSSELKSGPSFSFDLGTQAVSLNTNDKQYEFIVVNDLGELVWSQMVKGINTFQLPQEWQHGVYIASLYSNDDVHTIKCIKH